MVPYKRYGKINDPPDVCFAPFLRYKFYTFTMCVEAYYRYYIDPANSETFHKLLQNDYTHLLYRFHFKRVLTAHASSKYKNDVEKKGRQAKKAESDKKIIFLVS